MKENILYYDAYILRVWQDNEQWRATLTDTRQGATHKFGDIAIMLDVLTDILQLTEKAPKSRNHFSQEELN